VESGYSVADAVGLTVNTLRAVAAGKLGADYNTRNAAREAVAEFSTQKKNVSAGLRKGIERVEGQKKPLRDDEVAGLVEKANHRLAVAEGVLMAMDGTSQELPTRVREAAERLGASGTTDELREALSAAVEADKAVVELLGYSVEEAVRKRQPAQDTRQARIPAPPQRTLGEKLAGQPFDEQKHPRGMGGKFAAKGGGGTAGPRPASARGPQRAQQRARAPSGPSPEEVSRLLMEMGWEPGDLARYQKSVGLNPTGQPDPVTMQMLKTQAAHREAGPTKETFVLSADQPSKESGRAQVGATHVRRAKAKKRAGKPPKKETTKAKLREATVINNTLAGGTVAGTPTPWGGATTPLLVAGVWAQAAEEVHPLVTELLGIRGHLQAVVEARKAASAAHDTTTFTLMRADEIALRERLAEVEAEMERLEEVKSSAYPGLERSPRENWVERVGGLPRYIERIAKHLHYEKGKTISNAIAIAVNVVKKMCATGDLNFPGKQEASPKSKAQACAAVAQWEAKKARAKVSEAMAELVEAARVEGEHYYPSVEEAIEITNAAEAMDADAYPPLREADLVHWDPKKHPRNRLGQFTEVLGKLGTSGLGRGAGVRTPRGAEFDIGTGGGGGLAPGVGSVRVRPQRLRPGEPRGMGVEKTLTSGEDLRQKELWEIADMIRKEWKNPNFAAKPYLQAMGGMSSHTENYGLDPGRSIIAYFLSNASSFRGDHAKRIKTELRRRLKESADGVLLADKLEKLDRAVEEREAAATYGDSGAFVAARAREVALREAVLTATARKKLSPGAFAIPPDRYPIHDEAHARNALARVSQHGSPEEKAKVRAAVKRRYPHIIKGGETEKKMKAGKVRESHWLMEAADTIIEGVDLSAEGRKKMAEKGEAMSDGSWPIPNTAYLKKAIRALGRGKKSTATVKAWIIKRAKALNATGMLPESWNIQEAVLTSRARESLPSSAFVFPKEKRYPIHDRAHGANALARASGKPEYSTVKAAVCKRYPDLPACKEE
jgi:hypothetical protein